MRPWLKLLLTEPALNNHLAEATDDSDAKVRLVERLFGGKVDDTTLDILENGCHPALVGRG